MPVTQLSPSLNNFIFAVRPFLFESKGNKNVNTEGKYLYVPVFRRPPNVLPEEDIESKSCKRLLYVIGQTLKSPLLIGFCRVLLEQTEGQKQNTLQTFL